MEIKINWPTRGHSYLNEEINAVSSLLLNNNLPLTQSENVKSFEHDFGSYSGIKYCLSTMSAAHALDICGILTCCTDDTEIIIPAHTYCASALGFARYGAKIKWADIDPNSFTISLSSIKELINENTKAIVVVHLYGLICPEINEIVKFAKEKGILVIEDCAQSLGADLNGVKCGAFGDLAVFSFHAQKNLTLFGEGGMIATNNIHFYNKILGLRINGHRPFVDQVNYWKPAMVNVDQDQVGYWPIKSSLNESQGLLGSLLLKRLDNLTQKRRDYSILIRKGLEEVKELQFQKIYTESSHSHHLLPALCKSKKWNRDKLIEELYNNYGIKSIVQFYPLNRYDLFIKNSFDQADIPNTNYFFYNMISFPFSVTFSEDDIKYLINSIKSAVNFLNS